MILVFISQLTIIEQNKTLIWKSLLFSPQFVQVGSVQCSVIQNVNVRGPTEDSIDAEDLPDGRIAFPNYPFSLAGEYTWLLGQ